jgi:hypothetical protein
MPHAVASITARRRVTTLPVLLTGLLGLLSLPHLPFNPLQPTAHAAPAFIARDDPPPAVVITYAAVAEGDSGTTPLPFTVKLSALSTRPIRVDYSTEDSLAKAPEDYQSANGSLLFNPGETVKQVVVLVNGDTQPEPVESVDLRLTLLDGTAAPAVTTLHASIWDEESPGIHFSAPSYTVGEKDGSVEIKVVRRGDASGHEAVDYATYISEHPNVALPTTDYTRASGRLDFAPGETEKSFTILVNDDAYVEEQEAIFPVIFRLTPRPGEQNIESGLVILNSDDTQPPTAANNPVDDTQFFVRQHYHDFLNREPDPDGFQFWTNAIEQCGADLGCREVRRVSVSQAFFFSIEFQQISFRVFRFYRATFPDSPGHARGMPLEGEFVRDAQEIGRGVVVRQDGWQERLRQNVERFAREWVTRSEFVTQFPATLGGVQFVDKLFANSGITPTRQEWEAALAAYGSGGTEGRAAAILNVIDSGPVINRQYNPAFVYTEYVGYLRRGPVAAPELNFVGFDFWLAKLDSFTLPGEDVRDEAVAIRRVERAEMVKAFLSSTEYRRRFGL